MDRSTKMGDAAEHSKDIPKKYYRYFLKGLAYYTCHMNRACTLADLQAYVFLKSLQQLSEADLTYLSNEVMEQLVASEIAEDYNGYYRLNEWLRFANGGSSSSSGQTKPLDRAIDTQLSSGSGLKRIVNFSNTVTMWPTDAVDGAAMASRLPQLEEFVPLCLDDGEKGPEGSGNASESDSDEEKSTETTVNDPTKKEQPAPEKEQHSDTDDSSTAKESDDGSDEDADSKTIPHKPIKQEPKGESNPDPDSGDEKPKAE
ncbi:AGAP013156-PA [Anopheles gambiae str. PEST]|uniref:AGAP013156-PA n=1 Tax=Anopheles gambiae TaxID=7165 RepID=F5HKT9_ANOGA|nr:uncharacterized protein LOC11175528 [Anopheles gambiae]EGK96841.1 AGAP013156-PA [Anopheles gambiae str. PEST]